MIENNRYAMGTSVSRSSAETDFSHRGASFRIPGIQVDGMDVRAVQVGGRTRCRMVPLRQGLRSSWRCRPTATAATPCPIRRNTASKDEVQKMRSEHDPIEQVKARLIEKKWASEDELKAIDKEVRDIVADAAEFAQTDPEPDASELWTDIVH